MPCGARSAASSTFTRSAQARTVIAAAFTSLCAAVLRTRALPASTRPARLACTVKRTRSNTPLQALTLLNDPVHVEAARALAERVLREVPKGDEARLSRAFRLCVARPPREKELAILTRLLQAQRTARAGKPKAEELAWTDVATALLNLEETITKE